ncbi:MAG TPA: hypothetical protein ENJ77_01680 [Candidatus Moranbacteria bacterium]|nr:hypothetical protein [Candidatus Moranbacteria bacterium]
MKAKEILQLHKRINCLAQKNFADADNQLLVLAETKGWELLRGTMEQMIAELLEPIDFEANVPLENRAVVYEARQITIKALRSIIAIPESVKAARQSALDDKRAQKRADE